MKAIIPLLLAMSVSFNFFAQSTSTTDENTAYTIVDKMPSFPGGDEGLLNYIKSFNQKPGRTRVISVSGKVYVSFVIDTLGQSNQIKVLKGLSSGIDSLSVLLVKSMPAWVPGEHQGKKVPVQYTLPLNYSIKGASDLISDSSRIENKGVFCYDAGMQHFKNNNFNEAISFFNESLKHLSDHELDALFARGCAYMNLKDSASACRDWKTGYHRNDWRAAEKLDFYCGCFYDSEKRIVYFENAKEERMKFDSINNMKPKTFSIVEEMPQFEGGESGLVKYLQKNIRYPPDALESKITGTVFVTFVIDDKGIVDSARIIRGTASDLDAEAIRVIMAMPPWRPGRQNGKAVSVQYNLPVRFSLKQY